MAPQSGGHRQFIERVLIVIALAALAYLAWRLAGLLILVFASALFAVIFRAIANPLRDRLHLPDKIALAIAIILVFALVGFAGWLFGSELASQLSTLREAIPQGWAAVRDFLADHGLGDVVTSLREQISEAGNLMSRVGGFALTLGGAIANILLVLVGAIYFAARPDLYRRGLSKLVPKDERPLAKVALEDSGNALRLWLLGQLAAMVTIGVLAGLGLWALGVPSPLALGIVAALLEFIPLIGPIIAAVPAVLLAFTVSPMTALWVIVLYTVIEQLEGNVVLPIAQQEAVTLPPALLLFSLIAAGILFGIGGIILAAPLTVVAYVLVKRLYVREVLHTRTEIPGEGD